MPTNRRSDSRFREVPMRRRPAVTILMLVIVVILTLPLRAQQKIVAPTFRSACADLKVSATTAGFSPAKPFIEEQVSW